MLRVLVDRPNATTRFLVLGSAGPELLRQSSETLAGRIAYHELEGLGLDEVGLEAAPRLWLRGGFPRSFLAQTERDSFEWRRGFVRTFLERDLPSLGVQIPAPPLHRFWQMLSHYHGQTWNGAELARAFGVAATTVRRYLDLLASALVVRLLPPWFENIAKRQVKSPKVYIADTGVLHTLLGITDVLELEGHPKIGASWEGFVIKELVAHLGTRPEELFFWATHAGAELDLWWFGADAGWDSRSSARLRRPARARCRRLWRLCAWRASKSSMPESTPSRWHRGSALWRSRAG